MADSQVAGQLLKKGVEAKDLPRGAARPPQSGPLSKEFQIRFAAILLALLTVAAFVFAFINYDKEREFEVPDDGVSWVNQDNVIQAQRVEPGGPGDKAGVKKGDIILAIDGVTVATTPRITKLLYRTGAWKKATYSLIRGGVPVEVPVVLQSADRSMNIGLRVIALIYLSIGLYVLLRRWTAPKSTHFYLFCLVSFIFYSFHFTGKLNQFDWIIYWSNVVASLLQPALFLHFALTFPEINAKVRARKWLVWVVYAPAAALIATHIFVINTVTPSEMLRWRL